LLFCRLYYVLSGVEEGSISREEFAYYGSGLCLLLTFALIAASYTSKPIITISFMTAAIGVVPLGILIEKVFKGR
jgi:hypothetical protein